MIRPRCKLLWHPQPNIQTYRIIQLDRGRQRRRRDPGRRRGWTARSSANSNRRPSIASSCRRFAADQKSPLSEKQCATTTAAPRPRRRRHPRRPRRSHRRPRRVRVPRQRRSSAELRRGAQQPRRRGAIRGPIGRSRPARRAGSARRQRPGRSAATTAAMVAARRRVRARRPRRPPAPAGRRRFGPTQSICRVHLLPGRRLRGRRAGPSSSASSRSRPGSRRQVLRTTDFPQLQMIPGSTPVDSYLVYVGPFNTLAEAQARCAAPPVPGHASVGRWFPARRA